MSVSLLLLVVALACFVVGALTSVPRVNLVSAGLAFWVASRIVAG